MPSKQKSGLYRTKVVIGHDPDGKPINKWISASTKRELEDKRRQVVDQYINGNRTYENMLFGEYAVQWYRTKKEPFLAEGTQRLYRSVLNGRILPIFKDRTIKSITNMEIQSYINSINSLSESRLNTIRNIMYSIFDAAIYDGYITLNPAKRIRIEAVKPKEKYILTQDDRAVIESVCRTHEDGLLLALLYYTGMRDGELMALQWGDIDMNERTIHIHASLRHYYGEHIGSTKTPSSVRKIPISQPLYDIIAAQQKELPNTYVIHKRTDTRFVSATEFRIRWSRLMEACRLGQAESVNRHIHWRPLFSPHTLRHNFTTMLYENGIDPYTTAKLLGHSSIQTTMDIYTHFSNAAIKTTQTNLDSIFTKKQEVAK